MSKFKLASNYKNMLSLTPRSSIEEVSIEEVCNYLEFMSVIEEADFGLFRVQKLVSGDALYCLITSVTRNCIFQLSP